MSLQDPTIQRRLFAVLIAALLGYLYFGSTLFPFCYRVRKAEVTRLEMELTDQERKISIAMSKAGRLEVLQAALVKLEADWRQVEELLPREEDIPAFLREVARLATRSGVKIDLLQPGPTMAGEGFKSRSIEMKVHGDYHRVGRFLSHIANAQRVIRTEGLTLQTLSATSVRKNVQGAVKDGSVEASFKATLYMLEGSHAGS